MGNSTRAISFIRQSKFSTTCAGTSTKSLHLTSLFDLADYELFGHLCGLSRLIQIFAPALLQPFITRSMVSKRRLLSHVCGCGP